MVRRIFSSFTIDIEVKNQALVAIAEEDKSDWTEKTRYYSQAAIPTEQSKTAMWAEYFDKDDVEWGYSNYNMSFAGFSQITHRALTEKFND